jgi:N-acetylglucosamine-6-phosphate deacetylase
MNSMNKNGGFWLQKILIRNVRIVLQNEIITGKVVVVKGGRIESIEDETSKAVGDVKTIDGNGHLLIPGMIDVHIHGANGYDMMDGDPNSINEVSKMCARSGCTSFLATSLTSSISDLQRMILNVREVLGKEPGAKISGIHLEGPYINQKKKGMQNANYIRHPDFTEMETILDMTGPLIKMVTLAPELPGGMEMVTYLVNRSIIVSLAHSDASFEQAKKAFELGASHVTHCFNAMRPIHHRDPGLVVAAFEEENVSVQAIVDNIHLHPAIVRLMYSIKGAERMVLITDALQAMGKGDGQYNFGGQEVEVLDGVARLSDGTLASSTVTMNEALRKTVETGIPLCDAVLMAATTPAEILDLKSKGKIVPGFDADLVLLDDQFNVVWTMINGSLYND